jgi:hypothetical protein
MVYARISLLFARIFDGDDGVYNHDFPVRNRNLRCHGDSLYLSVSVLNSLLHDIEM